MAQGVNLLGVDFAPLDPALPKRLPGFDWQVQQVLVSNGAPVEENLANFGHLVRGPIELVWGALNLRGADSARPAFWRARLRPQAPGWSAFTTGPPCGLNIETTGDAGFGASRDNLSG